MADDGDIGLSTAALQAIIDGVATKLQEAGAETGAPPRADVSEGKLCVVNITPPPPYKV